MKPKNKTMGINEYDITDTEFWTNFTEYSTDNLQQSISDKTNLEDIIKTLKIFFFSLPLFILYFYDSFINALYTEPTVMFAMGRVPGWIAQWREMRLRKEPIGRPRQVYIGETHRPFKAMSER